MGKLSLKEKLAAKKAAAKGTKETVVKKDKKVETPVVADKKGRGRPKGTATAVKKDENKVVKKRVPMEVTTKFQDEINNVFGDISTNFGELEDKLGTFMEKAHKPSAKAAREALQNITVLSKGLRKLIQDAKANMEEKAA